MSAVFVISAETVYETAIAFIFDGFDIGLIVVFANKNYSLTFHDLCGIITIIQFINGR